MRIYFSGIGGVGIGPLAEIAHDAGYNVVGSDAAESLMTKELAARGVTVYLSQDGDALRREHDTQSIDWFVYTAALSEDHPELLLARELGIRVAKRDELLAEILKQKNLKLIAIAGTHGKTTTTGMLVWVFKQLGIPVSYSIGTTLSWGPSGFFDPKSAYFVYECDEFDRNFLHFTPSRAIITSIEHDHPDTYPTEAEYYEAFDQFIKQSKYCTVWQQDFDAKSITGSDTLVHMVDKNNAQVSQNIDSLQLPGRYSRENAYLVLTDCIAGGLDERTVRSALESFPGTNRRFEKLSENLYSDYGHHPTEITATLQMAREISDHIVLIYQPHQNIRQHEIRNDYVDEVFSDAREVYWLPTYLSREDDALSILSPEDLTHLLSDVHIAELNDQLWDDIQRHLNAGHLVLCMGAGSIDGWVRDKISG